MSPSRSPLLPARALRLAHGSTGHAQKRPRGQVYFAGACTRRRAGARLQLELRLPELELERVSPATRPLCARQPEPARKPGALTSQYPGRPSLVRSLEPRAGQPPGRSLASWDACSALALPGHESGCTVGLGRGERAGGRGRSQARPGGMRLQQPQRLGLLALGLMREAGARTPLRGGRSGQTTREMLSSWRERGLNAQAQLLSARQERDSGPWFSPNPGPGVRAGLGNRQSGAVSSEKVEDGALIFFLFPRYYGLESAA